MSHLLEMIADIFGSGLGVPERWTRLFVVVAMGVTGFAFLVFAGIAVARADVIGIVAALLLTALAVASFWLGWRARRS